uniref:Uncharacterized protein n=1 Tax=Rhizophagus irregularis (strain DAOM 181602 / DAOM 197198 / MUCL 43194) TaxID=747089 RepID=U9T2G9_RHIID
MDIFIFLCVRSITIHLQASSHPTSQIFISPLSTSPPPSSPTHASFTEDSTYSSKFEH